MLSTSFIAHYNAPGIYEELKDNTMARFNQVVLGAFGAATSITVLVMAVGFATFGGASSGLILNNYANSDLFASLARLAIGVAIVTGYPFAFSAVRDGILDIKVSISKTTAEFINEINDIDDINNINNIIYLFIYLLYRD